MGDKQAKAEYITPDPKLTKIWEIINEVKLQTARSMGISSESSKDVQYESGYKLKLSKQGVVNFNIQQRNYYRPSIKTLIRLMMHVWNNGSTSKQFPNPDDVIVNVDFGEVQFENNPLETEQLRALKIANGTWSPIMSIMEDNQDLTEEQAIEVYEDIQKQNSSYKVNENLRQAIEE